MSANTPQRPPARCALRRLIESGARRARRDSKGVRVGQQLTHEFSGLLGVWFQNTLRLLPIEGLGNEFPERL
jgi:hypothetical protein